MPGVRPGISLLHAREVTRVLSVMLLVLLAGAATSAVIAFVDDDRRTLGATGFCCLVLPMLAFALHRGRATLAATGTAALLLGVAVYVVVPGNGLYDPGMLAFPVVIVMSGMLLERWQATLMSSLAVLAPVLVGVGQWQGWGNPRHGVVVSDIFFVGVMLAALVLLVCVLTGALYRGLESAYLTERSYREIFDATGDAILVHDERTAVIVDANLSAALITGFSREELIGCGLDRIAQDDPEDPAHGVDELQQQLLRRTQDGVVLFEWPLRRKDGTLRWVELAVKAAWISGVPRVLTVMRDVHERREMQARAREADKLRAVGHLAGGLAHDFNNQLTGIFAGVSLLEPLLPDSPAMKDHLQVIRQCSLRSADLTRKLLAFARQGRNQNVNIDLHVLVDEVIALLERSVDKRITIRRNFAPTPLFTQGDPSLLQNALLNLALNARDAMPNGGRLSFDSGLLNTATAARLDLPASLAPGHYVSLRVADTGTGIPEETRARLFEPFFTTKASGSGMGLAAVYGTVRSHQGAILVQTALGRGTTFELLLPWVAAPEAEPPSPPRGPMKFHGLRILVAEDETDVARATVGLLEALGCVVELCRNGREALERFKAKRDGVDLFFLDHNMPILSGSEALVELRRLDTRAPIIITSGYTGSHRPADLDLADGFLAKPFTLAQLAEAIAAVLPREPGEKQ